MSHCRPIYLRADDGFNSRDRAGQAQVASEGPGSGRSPSLVVCASYPSRSTYRIKPALISDPEDTDSSGNLFATSAWRILSITLGHAAQYSRLITILALEEQAAVCTSTGRPPPRSRLTSPAPVHPSLLSSKMRHKETDREETKSKCLGTKNSKSYSPSPSISETLYLQIRQHHRASHKSDPQGKPVPINTLLFSLCFIIRSLS